MLRPVGLALRGSALRLYQGESGLLNVRGLTLPLRQGERRRRRRGGQSGDHLCNAFVSDQPALPVSGGKLLRKEQLSRIFS